MRGISQELPSTSRVPAAAEGQSPRPQVPGASTGDYRQKLLAPAKANQDLLEAFEELPAPAPKVAGKGPWIQEAVPFKEVAPTRLQVDPRKMLKAAALAVGVMLPAAAGAPRHYPSEEAKLLAKLEAHDRTMAAGRAELARMESRRESAHPHTPSAPAGVKNASEGAKESEGLRGAGALVTGITITMSLAALLKHREQKALDRQREEYREKDRSGKVLEGEILDA